MRWHGRMRADLAAADAVRRDRRPRPAWADLPADLRAAIAARLGSPVVDRAGTRAAASPAASPPCWTPPTGERAFVKAARLRDRAPPADWYAREAAITAALPPRVPAARPRWTLTAAGLLRRSASTPSTATCPPCRGSRPSSTPPWTPGRSPPRRCASRPPSCWPSACPTLADLRPRRPVLVAGDRRRARRRCRRRRRGAETHAATTLVALEAALPGVRPTRRRSSTATCASTTSSSTRPAAAWLCDWNWLCLGPAWFDTATLLVTAYASGLDADALFAAHPTAPAPRRTALDAALAALAGYCLTRRRAGPDRTPPPPARPTSAERRGWRWPGWPPARGLGAEASVTVLVGVPAPAW